MEPQKITELANLLRNNGDKILNSEFTLTLSGTLLRALNDSFTLIAESTDIAGVSTQTFQVLKPNNSKSNVFRDLQLIYDFVQKTTLLCIVHYPGEEYFEGTIDIGKFRALQRLEVQKTNVRQIVGIQPLRGQLQQLICVKSLQNVDDIITRCGGDNSHGFVWNELKVADFSYNNLQTVDTALEFAQYLQHLNMRHNQLHSVEAIKWLPHLKTLDLSYNCLQCIPQFHAEACKRLQSLNLSNNFVEDLMGIAKLDALTDLDLSDNCLLDHTYLLPLSALMTLKYLNLYGNPLHCHPKHRLATAQYLHKNTATVKFILDFEHLSKNEKAVTGSKQLRHVGSLGRFMSSKSSTASISSDRQTPASQTPASSVGSLRSFKFQESVTDGDLPPEPAEVVTNKKIRNAKVRTVEIEEATNLTDENDDDLVAVSSKVATAAKLSANAMTKSLIMEPDNEHLEAKRQFETLREKYGSEWLHSTNTEMIHSVLGIESANNLQNADLERDKSRQLFKDFIGELTTTTTTPTPITTIQPQMSASRMTGILNDTLRTSTPVNASILDDMGSPIQKSVEKQSAMNDDSTLYLSLDSNKNGDETGQYQSANESGILPLTDPENEKEEEANLVEDEHEARLRHIFSSAADDEPEVSEPEDDEETYIVYTSKRNEAIFLTLSANFLRERDTLTQSTQVKWSLKILESCERIKANTLRINFDTVKMDKKERVYTVEDGLCQELERKLRDILSQRDLVEMNQTIYRCVNCSCQFSRENKYRRLSDKVHCPDCKSTFVAEVHDIPKSLERAAETISYDKLSPVAIAEEIAPISTPLIVQTDEKPDNIDDTTSIGSANSLNESSSCSKISNSQSSFDSNQSVVGSSNTDRDNDFKSNCESDVDILSNPSQSSIEVLDQTLTLDQQQQQQQRKISFNDNKASTRSFIEREFGHVSELEGKPLISKNESTPKETEKPKSTFGPLAHVNLTESSSSGSVTDSVCTAYEQAEKHLLGEEGKATVAAQQQQHQQQTESSQKAESDKSGMKRDESGISNMLGALFQSTNLLMSSSKKLIDVEANVNIQTGTLPTPTYASPTSTQLQADSGCRPYHFNYSNFSEIDHRLKLYFYQTKFEDGEHFKWLVRALIYNEQTHTLCDGLLLLSNCKIYLMEAFAPQHDDVTKWLRQIVSVTMDRLASVQLLPWKLGLAFTLRDWGGFLLLLQDILRTDGLLLHFANDALPNQCELTYQPSEQLLDRLNAAVGAEQLKMCSLLNGCEVACDTAKRCLNYCTLLTTDMHLYLVSGKTMAWLSLHAHAEFEPELQVCVTQLMSNLVEVERTASTECTINFLDETQNKCELWHCKFATKENADSCLNAIGQSWEQLFGVPLLNA